MIFGSNHSFGIEKFLKIAWRLNSTSGDANFNIDEEKIADGVLSLFDEENTPKKLHLFEEELSKHILGNKIKYKMQIYSFAFNFGCLPKHANKIVRKLINENKIAHLTLSSQRIHKLIDEKIEVLK